MTNEDLKALAESVVAASSSDTTFRARVVAAELIRILVKAEAREHFCVGCHRRWTGDAGPTEYCGDCHRIFQELSKAIADTLLNPE